MSYQVLARKWRPRNFHQLVGQEHVARALINALDQGRLHHAYLFTGTRGVGKTTIARILAKCLNCEQGVTSSPCGVCEACVAIDENRFVDLIEVDAASRTKVEDTRELLDNVQYAPTQGRFKVYLIDEVHMLSSHSFNALLKTLEEPPPHVKFLLATTDPQKLPITVLSRCLQFALKAMSPERVVEHLTHILGAESIPFDEQALWLLGRAADGSMRDALSLTDQAIAFGHGQVRDGDVKAMLGTLDQGYIIALAEALSRVDALDVLQQVARLAEQAPDFSAVLNELSSLFHRLAIAQMVPEALDNGYGDRDALLSLAGHFRAEDVQLYYQIALNGRSEMASSPDARAALEMTLLRMLAFRPQGVPKPPEVELPIRQRDARQVGQGGASTTEHQSQGDDEEPVPAGEVPSHRLASSTQSVAAKNSVVPPEDVLRPSTDVPVQPVDDRDAGHASRMAGSASTRGFSAGDDSAADSGNAYSHERAALSSAAPSPVTPSSPAAPSNATTPNTLSEAHGREAPAVEPPPWGEAPSYSSNQSTPIDHLPYGSPQAPNAKASESSEKISTDAASSSNHSSDVVQKEAASSPSDHQAHKNQEAQANYSGDVSSSRAHTSAVQPSGSEDQDDDDDDSYTEYAALEPSNDVSEAFSQALDESPVDTPEASEVSATEAQSDYQLPEGTVIDHAVWLTLYPHIHLGGITGNLIANCIVMSDQNNHLALRLDPTQAAMNADIHTRRLENELKRLGAPRSVSITPGDIDPAIETPHIRAQRFQRERRQRAVEALQGDPHIQVLMEQFGARLLEESVESRE
ncbi:DNA_pol3_delta2 [Halomonadaceae bacterium LMG 33818]|uniref:DNA polymerase III subunit gamma/tau n=1 Tax=Cernens ardua TaxID=3402176 RepID=UPI003EDBB54A